ncbi:MAG: XisI protein [Oscillatoriales cyanobacterium]|nr:MAG: XisI protein [Oscillatoriales cyanobacterium]
MERIEEYRQFIRQLLTTHATVDPNSELDVECQLVFDTEQDHYQILDVGWEGYKRIYNCFIHLDIKDGKIWIQRNMTEADLGQELVEMGVPKEDIIYTVYLMLFCHCERPRAAIAASIFHLVFPTDCLKLTVLVEIEIINV